ncbi:MAG: zinc ribbon domain-containing protein [Haloplanus sp.]
MMDTERRAVVAALVSVVGATIGIAGAGHAYLREWGRAFAWFSLVLGMGLVLTATFTDTETVTVATLPLRVTGPVAGLLVLNTLDAYYVARRPTGGATVGPSTGDGDVTVSCPTCGRDLDPELSFCPWCAGSRNEGDGNE